jgi:small subunit ribosomal protein S1
MTSAYEVEDNREKQLMGVYDMESDDSRIPLEPDESWWAAVLADEPKIDEKDELTASILEIEPASGGKQNINKVNWFRIRQIYANDEIVKLNVVDFNRGGVLVAGEDIFGFVPISHLIDIPAEHTEEEIQNYLLDYQGRSIALKIIECEPENERIVFSERAALAGSGTRKHLLSCLKEGDVIEGIVTNITSFGAFIDLGGLEGLAHVSELSWGRVKHPGDLLTVGEKIEIMILQVSEDKGRIALSLKRLTENPWDHLEDQLSTGDIVNAIISGIVKYGAFARLEQGVEGLIHISSMNFPKGCSKIEDFLFEGQSVTVSVLNLEPQKRRLGLKLESYE